ncbi:hypothetical protein ACHAW5_007392 [Stephanodiscus triporus]|uniref:histidinol-phosphate transaminase n=1 Tax=Stephanodiscus triporus TaxID=2934178 RepID=A0ABD3QDH6_9STRA
MSSEEKKESPPSAPSSPKTTSTATTAGGRASLLARPNVLCLEPYRCARDDYDTGVLLDANENAYGPTSLPTNSLNPYDNSMELERYPCPYQREVKQLLCDYRNSKTMAAAASTTTTTTGGKDDGGGGGGGGTTTTTATGGGMITPENVFCGVGSDEAIDLLIRIFCRPGGGEGGDAIMITPPTYGMYKVCANVNDVSIQAVPLTEDFDLRVAEMLRAVTPSTKLIFVCSPGNPTSKSVPLSEIRRLASSPLYRGLVVVDEAYVDFSGTPSATSLVAEHDNVVVLQTLSKAFGLAGIRCGFAIGPPDVIRLMNNVKAPYNVSKLTSDAAINALRNTPTLEGHVSEILEQREVVARELESFDFVLRVYHSDANFLLFRVRQKANELYKIMADRGVVSRFRGREMHCDECIRVTIGKPEENRKFLDLLQSVYAEIAS